MKINVITSFSGYESQCLALKRLKNNYPDFDFELVAWSEFDPESNKPIDQQPAVILHNQLFPEYADRNLGDFTKIDWAKIDKPIDLFVYSSPCQSISNAGRMDGLAEGSGTRSSLLWYVEDAIKILKPKYLLQENVKNLVSKKFMPDFQKWCQRLESYGYKNFYKVLNAREFGVPQNRERVFMVSILKTEQEPDPTYCFPTPFELSKSLKDVLEEDVDERFYLKQEQVDLFLSTYGERKNKK